MTESAQSLRVLPQDLGRILKHTAFAGDKTASRYALDTVLLEVSDGVLHAAATNGRVLATDHCNATGASKDFRVLLPAKTAKQLAGFLSSRCGDMANVVVVGTRGEVTWISSQKGSEQKAEFIPALGRFPHWQDFLPSPGGCKGKIKGLASDFLLAIGADDFTLTLNLRDEEVTVERQRVVEPLVCEGEGKVCFRIRPLASWLRSLGKRDLVEATFFEDELLLVSGSAKLLIKSLE